MGPSFPTMRQGVGRVRHRLLERFPARMTTTTSTLDKLHKEWMMTVSLPDVEPMLLASTPLSDPQLTKPMFGLLHPPHVVRAADKQQPGEDFLHEGPGLGKRET